MTIRQFSVGLLGILLLIVLAYPARAFATLVFTLVATIRRIFTPKRK